MSALVSAQLVADRGDHAHPLVQRGRFAVQILAREDLDSEPAALNKRVRVVATVSYQLR